MQNPKQNKEIESENEFIKFIKFTIGCLRDSKKKTWCIESQNKILEIHKMYQEKTANSLYKIINDSIKNNEIKESEKDEEVQNSLKKNNENDSLKNSDDNFLDNFIKTGEIDNNNEDKYKVSPFKMK